MYKMPRVVFQCPSRYGAVHQQLALVVFHDRRQDAVEPPRSSLWSWKQQPAPHQLFPTSWQNITSSITASGAAAPVSNHVARLAASCRSSRSANHVCPVAVGGTPFAARVCATALLTDTYKTRGGKDGNTFCADGADQGTMAMTSVSGLTLLPDGSTLEHVHAASQQHVWHER